MSGGIFEEVQRASFSVQEGSSSSTGTALECESEDTPNEGAQEEQPEGPAVVNAVNCANALQAYRDSNGRIHQQVHLDCLRSPSCALGDASVSASEQNVPGTLDKMDVPIVCNFTEHTARSEWGNCETHESEESVILGNLLNFTATDGVEPLAYPVIKILDGYREGLEWGITKGCGGDDHVYLLYRNAFHGGEEGVYDVIGYQSYDAIMQNGGFVHGRGGVEGQGISGAIAGSCPGGWQYMTDLLGSCQLVQDGPAGIENGSEGNGDQNNPAPSSGAMAFDAASILLASTWVWMATLVLKAF